MGGIAHGTGYGAYERQDNHDEQQRCESHGRQCGGIYLLRILALLVGEAEESGLHAVGQDDEQQRRVGIYVGYYSVAAACRRQLGRIERHEQIVEKTSYDAAQSVDSSILCKRR